MQWRVPSTTTTGFPRKFISASGHLWECKEAISGLHNAVFWTTADVAGAKLIYPRQESWPALVYQICHLFACKRVIFFQALTLGSVFLSSVCSLLPAPSYVLQRRLLSLSTAPCGIQQLLWVFSRDFLSGLSRTIRRERSCTLRIRARPRGGVQC